MIRSTSNLGFAWAIAAPYIASGVTTAIGALLGRKRGGQKLEATDIVNRMEPELQQNFQRYQVGPRIESAQAFYVEQFDLAWAYLKSPEGCGTPALGPPGEWCISDRDRGGKHDWWRRYRDPIANDPDVRPDPPLTTQISEAGRQVLAPILTEGTGMTTVLIAAALIVGGLSLK